MEWLFCVYFYEKNILEVLLSEACDPYVRNSYYKKAFEIVQDSKDAAGNVSKGRGEIRILLLPREKVQKPQFTAERKFP